MRFARLFSLVLIAVLGLQGCVQTPVDAGGQARPGQKVYRISKADTSRIQYQMLDSVNALRRASGAAPLKLNSRLNAAAATHSRDMAVQNRPWHFGSDGSSPLDRIARVGYRGQMRGEAISETYETEIETLAAWMDQPDTRNVILDKSSADMGFSWHQEKNGKIWWTLVTGAPGSSIAQASTVPTDTLISDVQSVLQ